MADKQQPAEPEEEPRYDSPEALGESQAADAGKVSAPGGPGGTGQAGYRRIVAEGEDEYHRKHPHVRKEKEIADAENRPRGAYILNEEEREQINPAEVVSDDELREAIEGLQADRERMRQQQQKRKKSA